MFQCHTIQWETQPHVKVETYLPEANQLLGANITFNTKKVIGQSPQLSSVHSLCIVDKKQPKLYLTDNIRGFVWMYDGKALSQIKTSGVTLTNPQGILYDPKRNCLYIVNKGDHTICKMDVVSGRVETLCGKPKTNGFQDGQSSLFYSPSGITFGINQDELYVTDTENHVIRQVQLSKPTSVRTLGVPQTTNISIRDGNIQSALFHYPQDIVKIKENKLIVCERNGNLRLISLDTFSVRTIRLSRVLPRLPTRLFLVDETIPHFVLQNNMGWFEVKPQTQQFLCDRFEQVVHHKGTYFDKYNLQTIQKQPYTLSYSSPQDPSQKKSIPIGFSNQDLKANYNYHYAEEGNHIPYLSDGAVRYDFNDVFMYPHRNTPSLLKVVIEFIRYPQQKKGIALVVSTPFGYEGRLRIKHKGSNLIQTHIIQLIQMKTQWNLSLFPAIENPQMIEFIENVNINSQDYLSLLGKIQQWAMKYKLQHPRAKPSLETQEPICDTQGNCYLHTLQTEPLCCEPGSSGDACRKESKGNVLQGKYQCKDGLTQGITTIDGESKQILKQSWEQCSHCNQGYELREGGICLPSCICKHGLPAKGNLCVNPGSEVCEQCDPGYRMNQQNICVRQSNYQGTLTKLKQPTQSVNHFLWKQGVKTQINQGSQWTPTNKLNCFQTKQSSVRKQYKGENIPSFNVSCWKPDKGTGCFQSVSQKVNIQDPQSEVFQKEQCIQSKNKQSPCFQMTPCNPSVNCSQMKHTILTQKNRTKNILGSSFWSWGKDTVNYVIQLKITDHSVGSEVSYANHICQRPSIQQVQVSGIVQKQCNSSQIQANGVYDYQGMAQGKHEFINPKGYKLRINSNETCLNSIFGSPCVSPVELTYQGNNLLTSGCNQIKVTSHSLSKDDCQSCSNWDITQNHNNQEKDNVTQAFYNSFSSSILRAFHLRFSLKTQIPCRNLVSFFLQGDYIWKELFSGSVAKGILPNGHEEGNYSPTPPGIQTISAEGGNYAFEKRCIFTKPIVCQNITLDSKETPVIIRLTYCNQDHWKLSSSGNQSIKVIGDVWNPKTQKSLLQTCHMESRKPQEMESIVSPFQETHKLSCRILYKGKQIAIINQQSSQLCEPRLQFVSPLIGTKNKQVKQQLSKTIKEQYGYYHLFQNQYRLLNPYSIHNGKPLQLSSVSVIPLNTQKRCNLLISSIYRPLKECRKKTPKEQTLYEDKVQKECRTSWGDQTKINGKPLFSSSGWTLSAKPYRPDTMKGEQCCSPNRSKNEQLCILTKQNHRAMVCKQGYHLVSEESYLKNPKQVDKLKDRNNSDYCKSHKCLCVPNRCICNKGKPPKKGKDCIQHNALLCDDACSPGFRLEKEKCVQNKCLCHVKYEGIADSGWKQKGKQAIKEFPKFANPVCLLHQKNDCVQCPEGFFLKDSQCIPYKGECDNGILVKQTKRKFEKHCLECKTGYRLMNDGKEETKQSCENLSKDKTKPCICSPKPCQVVPPENGTMGDCLRTMESGKECKFKCNQGYTNTGVSSCNLGVFNSSSCSENVCRCPNGTPNQGIQCPSNQTLSCRSCNPGYRLQNDLCKPFQGECKNGSLHELSKRTKENHCGSCNDGYYLKDGTCVKFPECLAGEELQGFNSGGKGEDGLPGQCVPCPPDKYRLDGELWNTKCKPQPVCLPSQYVRVKGDSKTKRICENKRTCVLPTSSEGYQVNKQTMNLSLDQGSNFQVQVQCDTNKGYYPEKKVGARPCQRDQTPIQFYGCNYWCPILPNQYPNTGTCTDKLKSGSKCKFACPEGTCPVNGITQHRCQNKQLIPGKCSKEACIQLLAPVIQAQKEAEEEIEERKSRGYVPLQPASTSSVPKEVNYTR